MSSDLPKVTMSTAHSPSFTSFCPLANNRDGKRNLKSQLGPDGKNAIS